MGAGKVSREEYSKIVSKGRRWLMEYLIEIGANDFKSEHSKQYETKKKVFALIGDEYKRLMRENEDFFWYVHEFCSRRRYKIEKNAFCREVVTKIVKEGRIKPEMARRHPETGIVAK